MQMSLTAAASTMFSMMNFSMALSLGTRQAVVAASRLNMAAALFGTTIVPSFLGHVGSEDPRALFFYSLLISSHFLPSAYFEFSLLFFF